MSVSVLSRESVPRQRPNDDARNGSSPLAFARTTHCPHTASNCLPTYVCRAWPKADPRAAADPAPASIAPMLLLTKAYQYAKNGSSSVYNALRDVLGFSPNGTSRLTMPRSRSIFRYFDIEDALTPARSAIRFGEVSPEPIASRIELYSAGSRSSWRSSIRGSS